MNLIFDQIRARLAAGEVVPVIGAAARRAPSRAATEASPARSATLQRLLDQACAGAGWPEHPVHAWLAGLDLPCVIDLGPDAGLQQHYATRPHTLVTAGGHAAGGAIQLRFHRHDGIGYSAPLPPSAIDPAAPVLFKPCGTPWPEVEPATAASEHPVATVGRIGGVAVPHFLRNRQLKYLVAGIGLTSDTPRELLSEIIRGAAQPVGWALIPGANEAERHFYARLGLQVIDADLRELAGFADAEAMA